MIKLNLGGNEEFDGGGGSPRLDEFVHVDWRQLPRVSVVCDIRSELPVQWVGQVGEIRASHVIEHMKREDAGKAVRYWTTFLVRGGLMRIYCPDANELFRAYIAGHIRMEECSRMLFGEQDYDLNLHREAYDIGRLTTLVEDAGLEVVSFNPRPNAYPFDMGVQAVKV